MPYIPIIPIIIVVLLILLFAFVPMRLWITALASGSHVGIGTLIGMRLRKVPPARIVLPLIQARKAGLQLNTNQLESHYMAGGHVDAVVNALIASSRAGMNIPFEMAAAIDLAGRDVLEAVRMSVNPKVIETPNISAIPACIGIGYASGKNIQWDRFGRRRHLIGGWKRAGALLSQIGEKSI